MTKTINELAQKYCEGSSFEDAVMEKPAFIAGANAVLEEILTYIELKPAHKGERFYNALKDYIKQLKDN